MPLRSRFSQRSTSCELVVVLAAALLAATPAVTRGQQVGGSIGVSLTVLRPVATQSVEVTAVRLGHDGFATVETTAPTTGPTSQLLMARVSHSASGAAPTRAPVSVRAAGVGSDDGIARGRISHRVDVGRGEGPAAIRDVQLRIEYLAVAGT